MTCPLSEWLLHNANSAIFSARSWREQANFQWDDDEVHFVLDQHAELNFYSVSSLKQQFADRHVAPLGHIILIPCQPVLVNSLWFDPTGARTHDLPDSRRTRYPLRHRCSSMRSPSEVSDLLWTVVSVN
jgi:hypothetical protein